MNNADSGSDNIAGSYATAMFYLVECKRLSELRSAHVDVRWPVGIPPAMSSVQRYNIWIDAAQVDRDDAH
ncbi:unnamed protein product [Toxocara canis]|uniref:Fibronectin type-III domain-containing protein n=1 Tax=Toxocara canis TaxID=6265 RepID=A0A183VFS4_TOXCA|nr:unnamed protein product [Toxocara canis]